MSSLPRIVPIDDPSDPRVAAYRTIRDRDLLGHPSRPDRFVGEQDLIVRRMLARPGCTESVLVVPAKLARVIEHVPPEVPVYVASKAVMSAVVGFPIHRGVLAIGRRPHPDLLQPDHVLEQIGSGGATVLVLEDISHVDNLGFLFRVAAALAVDAVLLSPGCHDPLYRKALRLSIGHVLEVPWARVDPWPSGLATLSERWGLEFVAAATEDAIPLDACERPERVALLVGTERHGLSDDALALCRLRVRIPMAEGVDSLNVAVAAAICLHHLSVGKRV